MADSVNKSFFDALLDAKAAKWSAGVAFDRSNPLPLDQWSVFKDKAAAEAYLTNAKAYPGQVIAYAEADVKEGETLVKAGGMVACVLSSNAAGTGLELKQIGVIPTGAGAINVTEDGEISVNIDNSTIKIVDGKLVAVLPEIPEFEDADTTYSVKDGEKVLKLEGTEFSTELGLKHENGKISLTGINGQVIAEFSDAEFVADGVLEDVSYNEETKDLIFTWNVVGEDGKKKTDTVNIADLVDVNTDTTYTISGNGVSVTLTPSEGEATTVTIDAYTKSETDSKIDEKIASVTGGESAADVKLALESYRDALNREVWGDDAGKWTTTKTEDGKTVVTYTPAYGTESRIDKLEKVGAQANVIEEIKVNGTKIDPVNKSVDIAVPTKTSQLTNDSNFIVNVKMRDASAEAGYTPVLAINRAENVVTVDDEALQNTIKAVKATADGAVQSGEFAGKAMTKDGTKLSISQADAREALGLKGLAYVDSIDTGVMSVTTGSANGTISVDGSDVAVKGLGSAAYTDGTAYDAAGSAAAVLGKDTDASTAATVHGARNLAASILGSEDDGASAKTVYGAHAAVAALTEGAVKANTDAIAALNKDVNTAGSVAHTAKTAADTAVTNLVNNGQVKTNTDAIATLVGTDANKSARAIAKEEVALIVGAAPEAMDTLEEVAKWIADDASGAAAMAKDIKANTDAIAAINNETTGILALAKAHSDSNLAAAKKYTDDSIDALRTSIHGVDDKTIKLNESNNVYVAEVSTDVLTQGSQELVLCAGDANGYHTTH